LPEFIALFSQLRFGSLLTQVRMGHIVEWDIFTGPNMHSWGNEPANWPRKNGREERQSCKDLQAHGTGAATCAASPIVTLNGKPMGQTILR